MPAINGTWGTRSRRLIRGSIAAGLGAAALTATFAMPATAGQPNHRACLGHDVSSYAQGGSQFGSFVAALADDGVGTEIQAHLAGEVPDEVVPNSCND